MSRLLKLMLSPFVVPSMMIIALTTHGAGAMVPDSERTATDAPMVLGGTEACCFDPNGCLNLTPTDCATASGISGGPGTPATCPPNATGAGNCPP